MSNKLFKKEEKKKIKITKRHLIAAGVSAVGVALIAAGLVINHTDTKDDILADDSKYSTQAKVLATSYVNETSYTNSDISWQLYDVPFVEDDDEYYIKNKDLLNQVDGTLIDEYIETSEEYLRAVYEVDYRTVAEDVDAWVDGIIAKTADVYVDEGDEELEADKQQLYDLAEWYVDNQIVTEVSYESDRSLVWQNLYYRAVRGHLAVTIVSCKDDVEGTFLDIMMPVDDDFVVEQDTVEDLIVDCEFDFTDTSDDLVICGYSGQKF